MCGSSESNKRARANGEVGEDEAEELLLQKHQQQAVKRVNGLIDFLIDHTWVEVKSCQTSIIDRSKSSGRRSGRFVLDLEQHTALQMRNGLYMFIVLDDGRMTHHRVVRARDLEFTNCLTWTRIMHTN